MDEFRYTVTSSSIAGLFTQGYMLAYYGSSVPAGWLVGIKMNYHQPIATGLIALSSPINIGRDFYNLDSSLGYPGVAAPWVAIAGAILRCGDDKSQLIVSGDGFAELATLDSDNNGWIDENDAAYEKLSVWTKDSTGKDQLSTLKEANVGAISLARVATPFELKDSQNDQQGEIRATGIYLREDGAAGTIQQIDLTV